MKYFQDTFGWKPSIRIVFLNQKKTVGFGLLLFKLNLTSKNLLQTFIKSCFSWRSAQHSVSTEHNRKFATLKWWWICHVQIREFLASLKLKALVWRWPCVGWSVFWGGPSLEFTQNLINASVRWIFLSVKEAQAYVKQNHWESTVLWV